MFRKRKHKPNGPHRTRNPVSKALRVLAWVVQQSPADFGVREMAAALKMAPSVAHRLLAFLAEEGLVSQDRATLRYALGLEFMRLAHVATTRIPLREVAMRHMRTLRDACNETVVLGLYDAGRQEMMFAAWIESTHSFRYAIELNRWIPVHAGASGLAILAFLPPGEVQSIVERTRLAPLTDRTITESYRLEAELELIRRRGYAFSRGQRLVGTVGIAAPVFNSTGQVIGDICLTVPEQRFVDGAERHLAEVLLVCAGAVTRDLGGLPARRKAVA